MALLYKLHKDNRQYLNNEKKTENPNYNKWLARAVMVQTMNLKELAESVSYSTTVTVADCQAVLTSLVNVMASALQDSKAVRLDGLGLFRMGLESSAADSIDAFSTSKNITAVHVNFLPEYTVDTATNKRICKLTDGTALKETPKNAIV